MLALDISLPFPKLSGPLPDTVKARQKPYLVVGDIEVPINKTVIIEKGVVFLFKAFTGMHVIGKLDARGTQDAPVIFTSENDHNMGAVTSLNPVPYDWNGIYIHSFAVGSRMAFCSVRYSVYGIVSETKFIKLNPATFMMNGKSDCVIEGKNKAITDKPYWYNDPSEVPADPLARKRRALRFAGLALSVAAGAGAVYYGVQWNKAQIYLSQVSVDDPWTMHPNDSIDWVHFADKKNNYKTNTIITGILTLLGMVGFRLSFTF